MPHGIGNIGDKISSKESHDAHGNVLELPSGKRLLKVHASGVFRGGGGGGGGGGVSGGSGTPLRLKNEYN